MYLGLVDGKISKPFKAGIGKCPACNGDILAKCGEINIWHWAHKNSDECSYENESETYWHRYYKKYVPTEWIEQIIRAKGEMRRADILKPTYPSPIAFEFQHSSISADEIRARENFYLNKAKMGMIWIFDLQEKSIWQSGEKIFQPRFHLYATGLRHDFKKDDAIRFYWSNGQKSILHTTTKVYLDLGNYKNTDIHYLVSVQSFSDTGKFSGIGTLYSKEMFLNYELLFHLPRLNQ